MSLKTLTQITVPTGPTGGVALASSTGSKGANRKVYVQAPYTNTASIWIGASDIVSPNGIELAPGDGISLDLNDPSAVHAIAATGSQKVQGIVH